MYRAERTAYSVCRHCSKRILKRDWSKKWAHDKGSDGTDYYCYVGKFLGQFVAEPVPEGVAGVMRER